MTSNQQQQNLFQVNNNPPPPPQLFSVQQDLGSSNKPIFNSLLGPPQSNVNFFSQQVNVPQQFAQQRIPQQQTTNSLFGVPQQQVRGGTYGRRPQQHDPVKQSDVFNDDEAIV